MRHRVREWLLDVGPPAEGPPPSLPRTPPLRFYPQSHADELLTRFGPWLRSHNTLAL
jgi:hypothetical protein